MRTPRVFYAGKPIVYSYELDVCAGCEGPLRIAYTSGAKTVQTMSEVLGLAHQPRECRNPDCARYGIHHRSARWEQSAPRYCTFGYDVIAQIGWVRQTQQQQFEAIHESLQPHLELSESQVRHLYHERYLPLLACNERQSWHQLNEMSAQSGLLLSLDGLCPEGGEPQLWVVRELQSGLTLRSGWLSQQDESTFVNFLQPIADLGLHVAAVLSDKQRGLEPAVPVVFPQAKHAYCQMHYLKNIAEPVAEEDEAMKVALRKDVRSRVGVLIRQEKVESPGVLTVTGLIPSPVEEPPLAKAADAPAQDSPILSDPVEIEREAIVRDILRRVRYLLTLKGRPPFRLAGIEMFERLSEVAACLDVLLSRKCDDRLLAVSEGLHQALLSVHADYIELRQAADWLEHIADLLDPEDKPQRSGAEVKQQLFDYLDDIKPQNHLPRLSTFYDKIGKTSRSYAPGLFHCYDLTGLPRTNNERESEFRDLNRRLLSTTGQRGLAKRMIHRQGAWELIPRPGSLPDTVTALSQVDNQAFVQERQRLRNHRSRFRLHTRSATQSKAQLEQLAQRWSALYPDDTS